MANIWLDPSVWSRNGTTPPNGYGPTPGSFNSVISGGSTFLDMNRAVQEGDYIELYLNSAPAFIELRDGAFNTINTTNGDSSVWPSGDLIRWNLDAYVGQQLSLLLYGGCDGGPVDITAPQEVVRCLPWWLCSPKTPKPPCPERPTEFVPFSDYDQDFKYPLASSRVPLKIERPDDCIVCRPNLIDEETPVDECFSAQVTPYSGPCFVEFYTMPDWFVEGEISGIWIRINGETYDFYWSEGNQYCSEGHALPFTDYEQPLVGEVAAMSDVSPEDIVWSCISISTWTPA